MKTAPASVEMSAAIVAIEQEAHVSPWSETLIQGSFSNRHHNFVLVDGGQLLGYMFTSFVAGELTLENICIAKTHQGKGLSKVLMHQLDQLAKELEAEEIWLEVRQSNRAAIALYQQFEFELQGVRKNYYSVPASSAKEDALMMKKAV